MNILNRSLGDIFTIDFRKKTPQNILSYLLQNFGFDKRAKFITWKSLDVWKSSRNEGIKYHFKFGDTTAHLQSPLQLLKLDIKRI